MTRSTVEDDRWALNNLRCDTGYRTQGVASYRYLDQNGVVHRAAWSGNKWRSLCGQQVEVEFQKVDPGSITCMPCLANGA